MAILDGARLLIAGLGGDSGKTLVSLGLVGALGDRGLMVRPFKKGPDYIDPAWLALAAGRPCRNLDTFLMSDGALVASLAAAPADLCLVEGNRGLFDGMTAAGEHSSAELAKRLGLPVVLVVDVTKVTRTAAALVLGCRMMDLDLHLAGVVLNRVATPRQERVVRTAVETEAGVPVLGAIPRLRSDDPLPGRHLGLVTPGDHAAASAAVAPATALVRDHVDLDRVLALAATAPTLQMAAELPPTCAGSGLRIGYFADRIFSFYYPENLERLAGGGAELVPLSPLEHRDLPDDLDGLYIGGGFPEVHAAELAGNDGLAESLRTAVEGGLPVFAECGGLMYLARELVVDGVSWPMAGVLDLAVLQERRPQGHGYVVAEVDRANPFYPIGTRLVGHEFHYSRVLGGCDVDGSTLDLRRGAGFGPGRRDGLVKGRVWASYLHQHALGSPGWADGFLALARTYRAERHERCRAAV